MLVIANVVKLCITLNLPIRRLIIDSQFHPPILVEVDRHSCFLLQVMQMDLSVAR